MLRFLMTAVVVASVFAQAPAFAQETGLSGLHAQARVGGKICMTEHEHYGEGTMPTRPGAQQAAVRAWVSFTAFEYGDPWGSYASAVGKRMDCAQSSGKWECKTWARPCKRGR